MMGAPPPDATVDGVAITSPRLSSEDDFNPAQLLFSDGGGRDSDSLSSQISIETPTFLNFKDIGRPKSEKVVYSPLSFSDPTKSHTPTRETLVDEGPHVRVNGAEEGTSLGGGSKESIVETSYSGPAKPFLATSSRGLGSSFMGSGDDNKMEAGASKRSDFKETFYEEPGSIHLIERARGTEPDPVAYKGLEEALLSKPSRRNLGGGASFLGQRQKFKDVPFLLLYAGSALLFFMVNLVILVKSSQSASLVGHASSSIYRAIQGSLIGVSLTIVVSILVGLSWLASICLLTKPLLWFTFLSVPAASILMFLLMLTRGFIGFSYQGQGSDPSNQFKLLSLIPLSVAVVHSLVVHRYHASIRQAVEVIRLSALILKSNVDILGASLFCLAIHVLFSCVWLVSFDRLFLLGHVDTISGKTTWVHDDTLYWLVPFYVGFFWWTSNIINNAERCTIAGTVSQWYFHQESNYVSGYNPAKVALRRSLTTSLGSLSLAGLLMAVVKLLNFARATHERFLKGPSPGLLSFCIRLVVSPVIFAARFVEGLSFFTVTYVGISGKPFFTSARIASTILHRNFFQCLLTNYLIRATIYAAIITTSTVSMFAFFSYSAGSLGTSHPLAVGILGLSIPFFILRFMMNILVYTMDAVYLCYGIDVDQKTTHFAPAHRVLSQSG